MFHHSSRVIISSPLSPNMDLHPLLILLLCLPLSTAATAALQNDTAALLLFQSQADPHGNLLSYWTTTTTITTTSCPTTWLGVRCLNDRVSALSLPNLNLRGPIDALSSLDQLRLLDLHNNRLNGTIFPLTRLINLKFIYLSQNDFSGEIPPEISSSLHRLLRLDLSDNNLVGLLPSQLSNFSRLLTLRLHDNAFSGPIPPSLILLRLEQLNLSNNVLSGRVPIELYRRFGEKCFVGNLGLCGSAPFPRCSSSDFPLSSPSQTVLSSPGSIPLNPLINNAKKGGGKNFLSRGAVVALLVSNSVLVFMVAAIVVVYCCNMCSKGEGDEDSDQPRDGSDGRRKKVFTSNAGSHGGSGGGGGSGVGECSEDGGGDDTDKSRLVFFDRRKQFELEELLRASAEMLGKGSLGTVYKAMLEDGCTVVAVKRLKDANPCARKEFEQYMDVIGRLRHPNVVSLKAYYYAKEEKLLVYDYLSNGTLYSLLHGNRRPGRVPLDWTTRISLVLGAARGLARIHTEYNSTKIPHGNVKSSNILLDKNGLACISDFGLSLLLHPADATARLGGYKAPEQSETKKLSQQADVYSFGVLVLEVLTGREPPQFPPSILEEEEQAIDNDLPKWVRSVVREEWTAEVFDEELLRYKNIEEEMVAMLQVALACVVADPEIRPSMVEVVKMIEEIRIEQSPLGEEYDESRNSLSPSFVATE